MGRNLQLKSHYPIDELKARFRGCRDPVEARRWQLIWQVSNGQTLTAASTAIGFNYDYARDIVKAYNAEGAAGLRNRRRQSRPHGKSRALLNAQQRDELKQQLQTPPPDGGVWSGPKVAQAIAKMTGRQHVWPQRGWDYLKWLGYSCQVPRPRHQKADAAAQNAFKKNCRSARKP